jgi:hypothetical protein
MWQVWVEIHLRPYVKHDCHCQFSWIWRLLDNLLYRTPTPNFMNIQHTV